MKEKEEDAKSRFVLRNQRIFATETTTRPYLIIGDYFRKEREREKRNIIVDCAPKLIIWMFVRRRHRCAKWSLLRYG